jgi:hypothetical protein
MSLGHRERKRGLMDFPSSTRVPGISGIGIQHKVFGEELHGPPFDAYSSVCGRLVRFVFDSRFFLTV